VVELQSPQLLDKPSNFCLFYHELEGSTSAAQIGKQRTLHQTNWEAAHAALDKLGRSTCCFVRDAGSYG
jgi:hypothetical protein